MADLHTTLLPLPTDLVRTIDDFVRQLEQRDRRSAVVRQIASATHSRRNGFQGQSIPDSEDEHWSFWCGEREQQFQAINCLVCGEYRTSGTVMPVTRSCTCSHYLYY